jgi:hypothetical protein
MAAGAYRGKRRQCVAEQLGHIPSSRSVMAVMNARNQGDLPMNIRSAGYWTTTTLIALAFLSGGAAYLFRAEVPLRGMAEL